MQKTGHQANSCETPPQIFSPSNVALQVSNYVFGPVPSRSEVDFAVSVLESFVLAISPDQSQPDRTIQMLNSPTSKLLISCGLQMLHNSFRLWQLDPFVKRLVVSLASDSVLWDAIMKNELVTELGKKPLCLDSYTSEEGENGSRNSAGKGVEFAGTILLRIWEMAKAKVVELVDNLQCLMNKMFQREEIEKLSPSQGCDEALKEKVAASFLLSVVIMLIVIVVRAGVGL